MPISVNGKTSFAVLVIRNLRKGIVIEDEVIRKSEDRYKSTKFRHTYYKATELFRSEQEAFDWIIASGQSGTLQ